MHPMIAKLLGEPWLEESAREYLAGSANDDLLQVWHGCEDFVLLASWHGLSVDLQGAGCFEHRKLALAMGRLVEKELPLPHTAGPVQGAIKLIIEWGAGSFISPTLWPGLLDRSERVLGHRAPEEVRLLARLFEQDESKRVVADRLARALLALGHEQYRDAPFISRRLCQLFRESAPQAPRLP